MRTLVASTIFHNFQAQRYLIQKVPGLSLQSKTPPLSRRPAAGTAWVPAAAFRMSRLGKAPRQSNNFKRCKCEQIGYPIKIDTQTLGFETRQSRQWASWVSLKHQKTASINYASPGPQNLASLRGDCPSPPVHHRDVNGNADVKPKVALTTGDA